MATDTPVAPASPVAPSIPELQKEVTRLNILLQCQSQTINTLSINLTNALSEVETLKNASSSPSSSPTK